MDVFWGCDVVEHEGGHGGEDADEYEARGEGDEAKNEGGSGEAGAGGWGAVVEGGGLWRHGVLLWERGEAQELYEVGMRKVRRNSWGSAVVFGCNVLLVVHEAWF